MPPFEPPVRCHDEKGVEIAEEHVAGLRLLAHAGNLFEQPMNFEAAEVGGQRQAGLGTEAILATLVCELRNRSATRISCQTMAL